MATATAAPNITQRDITRYAKVSRLYLKLEREKEALGKRIKEHVKTGAPLPSSGPYLVIPYEQERPPSWKDITAKVVDSLGEQLKKRVTKLIDQLLADKSPTLCLRVDVNPEWRSNGKQPT